MERSQTVSMADRVFERLEDDILSGKYAPGEMLTELKLCAELDVSRTPVREALKRLMQENLIYETGKGMAVCRFDEDDINDIYEIRSRIEGLAFSMCAEKITDEELKKLRDTLELQLFMRSATRPTECAIRTANFTSLFTNTAAAEHCSKYWKICTARCADSAGFPLKTMREPRRRQESTSKYTRRSRRTTQSAPRSLPRSI